MINVEDFVIKYNGVKVDFDGVFGPQCVDLVRQSMKEVNDIPEHTGACATTGGAKDMYIDYPKMEKEKKYFSRLNAKANFIPGDYLIWDSTETNKFGHIAIFLAKLNNSLIVFEQDGFKQDGAKIAIRSRKKLLGALRKK